MYFSLVCNTAVCACEQSAKF